jgi:FtsP/CotA-like multicopper oxidase with cupredoxin domain
VYDFTVHDQDVGTHWYHSHYDDVVQVPGGFYGAFNIVAEDGHMLPQPIQKDTVSVTPGDTYDLTFYAWAAPGSIYPFHCHILSHLMNPGQTGDQMGGLIALIIYAK